MESLTLLIHYAIFQCIKYVFYSINCIQETTIVTQKMKFLSTSLKKTIKLCIKKTSF